MKSTISKLHYHVQLLSSNAIVIEPTIWHDLINTKSYFNRVYNDVISDTNLTITSIKDSEIIFSNFSKLVWYACNRDCEQKEPPMTNPKFKPPAPWKGEPESYLDHEPGFKDLKEVVIEDLEKDVIPLLDCDNFDWFGAYLDAIHQMFKIRAVIERNRREYFKKNKETK
jgi:hypothetical protein